jgi:ABC-type multidrug transport system fused ATPase/permease subunit
VLYVLRPRPVNLVLRFFKRYVRRNIPQYALGLVMLVATNYAVVRVPTLIGNALDALGPTGPGGVAGLAAGQSIALELMFWALAVVIVRTLSRVLFFNPGRDVEFRLGVDLFSHLLAMQRPVLPAPQASASWSAWPPTTRCRAPAGRLRRPAGVQRRGRDPHAPRSRCGAPTAC